MAGMLRETRHPVVGAHARRGTTSDVREVSPPDDAGAPGGDYGAGMRRSLLPNRVDVAVAVGLAAYGTVEAAVARASPLWFAGILAAALPLAWRRRYPVEVIAWTLGMMLASGAYPGEAPDTVLPLPLLIVVGYTAGREAATPRLGALAALAIAATATVPYAFGSEAEENTVVEDIVAVVVLVGGSAGAGHLLRIRRRETAHLQALTAQLAAEQESRAHAAVAEERVRMARELHDIVAHGVSLIAVQAAAAEDLLDRDPDRARASLSAVQATARDALSEMRRLLSVLRADDAVPGLAPQPGLASAGELVRQAREAGLDVHLREEGEPVALAAGLDLSAYRILQEALTNARKHAGASPTEVLVRHGTRELTLEVVNELRDARPANGDADGHGLAGMRERARIYGGTLEAGPDGDRYVVRARLPSNGGDL